jgi:hypothetical protein
MADRQQTSGVGGLPFSYSPPSPPVAAPSASSPSSSPPSPAASASAESVPSASPLLPPPHLGPGGIPLPPSLSLPASALSPPRIRGWTERLSYETGTSYALGFIGGGVYGVLSGVSRPLPGGNPKLRLNAVLNSAGKSSSQWANSLAVFSLLYSISRSTSRWAYRRFVAKETQPAPYIERDDAFEGLGVAVAGSLTAFTRMPASRAVACGAALGCVMVGGLKVRRKYIDQRGVRIPHI